MNYHQPTYSARRLLHTSLRVSVTALMLIFFTTIASAQEQSSPLKPPDRSSPRAALETFLDSADLVDSFVQQEYLVSQSRAKYHQLVSLLQIPLQSLDLSEIPSAARVKTGRASMMTLYEVLRRIQLPALDAIPDATEVQLTSGEYLAKWVIPDTEIALARVQTGPRTGEYLFSADTVVRAPEFYERVKSLPFSRPGVREDVKDLMEIGGGWLVSYTWIQSMPAWLRISVLEQAIWKWIGVILILGFFTIYLVIGHRLSRLISVRNPFQQALVGLVLPALVFAGIPVLVYLLMVQINISGFAGGILQGLTKEAIYLASAWFVWHLTPLIAEGIIASPNIPTDSIDAHIIRIASRLLGGFASIALLALGASQLGIPVYGIVAGLGVGGIAVALAAQPTIENLIGGLSLFADNPARIGDSCEYDGAQGVIETIGIRSTRIRGGDKTLTVIPNAILAKMAIVNRSRRDQIPIDTIIGLRYETSPDQLRNILAKLREMLQNHPRICPDQSKTAFAGYRENKMDIRLHAFVLTGDEDEFRGIQEDVLLRVMDIVKESGTDFFAPSTKLNFRLDKLPDELVAQAAQNKVQE